MKEIIHKIVNLQAGVNFSKFDKYWYKSTITLCIEDMYCAHSFIHLLNSACTIFQYFLQQNFVLQH